MFCFSLLKKNWRHDICAGFAKWEKTYVVAHICPRYDYKKIPYACNSISLKQYMCASAHWTNFVDGLLIHMVNSKRRYFFNRALHRCIQISNSCLDTSIIDSYPDIHIWSNQSNGRQISLTTHIVSSINRPLIISSVLIATLCHNEHMKFYIIASQNVKTQTT